MLWGSQLRELNKDYPCLSITHLWKILWGVGGKKWVNCEDRGYRLQHCSGLLCFTSRQQSVKICAMEWVWEGDTKFMAQISVPSWFWPCLVYEFMCWCIYEIACELKTLKCHYTGSEISWLKLLVHLSLVNLSCTIVRENITVRLCWSLTFVLM